MLAQSAHHHLAKTERLGVWNFPGSLACHATGARAKPNAVKRFLTGKKVSECERSQSGVEVSFSHDVTVGDSHGREPVGQHSTVVFSPEGTTGNNAK